MEEQNEILLEGIDTAKKTQLILSLILKKDEWQANANQKVFYLI